MKNNLDHITIKNVCSPKVLPREWTGKPKNGTKYLQSGFLKYELHVVYKNILIPNKQQLQQHSKRWAKGLRRHFTDEDKQSRSTWKSVQPHFHSGNGN